MTFQESLDIHIVVPFEFDFGNFERMNPTSIPSFQFDFTSSNLTPSFQFDFGKN